MPYSDDVFPQDSGTGLSDTVDWDDAGGFAHLVHNPNATDYVERGFTFEVNWSTNTLNITEGVAMVSAETTQTNDHTDKGGEAAKVLQGASFKVQRGPTGDIALTSNAVNHVFIGVDQTSQNRVLSVVNTSETPPSPPFLKLGAVDTGGANSDVDDITYANRVPAAHHSHLLIGP